MIKNNLYVLNDYIINLDNISFIESNKVKLNNNELILLKKESMDKLIKYLIKLKRIANPEDYIIDKLVPEQDEKSSTIGHLNTPTLNYGNYGNYGYFGGGSTASKGK